MEETWNNFYPVADDSDREKLKFIPRVKRHITESISGQLWLKMNHIFSEKNNMRMWDKKQKGKKQKMISGTQSWWNPVTRNYLRSFENS